MTIEKVAEILDKATESLQHRRRDKDWELAEYWAEWLEMHAALIREVIDDNDT